MRALVELRPSNIEKLGGKHFFSTEKLKKKKWIFEMFQDFLACSDFFYHFLFFFGGGVYGFLGFFGFFGFFLFCLRFFGFFRLF